jgi:hypothetical protein
LKPEIKGAAAMETGWFSFYWEGIRKYSEFNLKRF